MAPPKNGFEVDLPELFSHARAVVQMRQPLDQVVAAVKEVTPNYFDLAYGILCQPFAALLIYCREGAEDTVNYNPVDKFGPLANVGAANMDNWFTGAGAADNAWALYREVTMSSKQNYGLMLGQISSLGLDGASAVNNPVSTAVSWLTGWALEHIEPLKIQLDLVTGDPQVVGASAETWKNIGNELTRLSKHYTTAVAAGTGGWSGQAATAYREQTAKNTIDALAACGGLAHTLSVVVATGGELVNLVRSTIRDLIAQTVGELVGKRFGFGLPTDALMTIAQNAQRAKKLISFRGLIRPLDVTRFPDRYARRARSSPMKEYWKS